MGLVAPCVCSFVPLHSKSRTIEELDEKLNRIQDLIKAALDKQGNCTNERLKSLALAISLIPNTTPAPSP